MNSSDSISDFESGNPRDYWVEQAHKLADRLNLPRDFIGEARHIVEGAFTSEWLNSISDCSYSTHTLIPNAPHRLAALFGVAGKAQVVELMELAVYLKRFAQCDQIQAVINVLKDHYATGFLQLAFAYRFQRAGCTAIELEPATDRGKSDIFFTYDDRPYLVECYVPSIAERTNSLDKLKKCSAMIMRAANACPKRLRISLRLKAPIPAKAANNLGWQLSRLIRNLGPPYLLLEEGDYATCEVRPLERHDDDLDLAPANDLSDSVTKPDAIMNIGSVPSADIGKIRLGEDVPRRQGNRLVLWRPKCEREPLGENEYCDQLQRRLSGKLRQTARKSDTPGRIAVVELKWFVKDIERSHRIGRRLQERLVPQCEDLAAIFLVERNWLLNERYRFGGLLVGGKSSSTVPAEFFKLIDAQEQTHDVLADWQ